MDDNLGIRIRILHNHMILLVMSSGSGTASHDYRYLRYLFKLKDVFLDAYHARGGNATPPPPLQPLSLSQVVY
jgi:hypothetical protein